ncbi:MULTISPECIES: bifunctional acetaldehyde-CoA/alcohol dehydrogenase [Clostridiaceae]|uniref:Aldehyde-alcohol dehydrogenase n=1 Tax=Clostridium facile TaxID=2763035 RepID=A0ABR7INF7_9CLOT|nr:MULTISPECIES: bifunctional acetaldehyde-CoA/alcohol dehydrogenase [Clostridiaceae]MBC5786661.1 bifunctional acetaldehyde-CoA/alcohol dehydrogenase [Clostridium facile]
MATNKTVTIEKQPLDTSAMIDNLVSKAKNALEEFMSLNQQQVDHIVHQMALAGLDNHMKLAKMAVEETKRGVCEDKIIKNMFATEYIWHSIKDEKTVGIINDNELEGYMEVAEPIGVIAGVTPVTNPTSTTMFKALIAIKSRNPIIFGFHPSAQNCSAESARILRDAAIQAGAPENCIQWIDTPSIEATGLLMNHPGVNMILATGGPGMVKAAYSAGKPALGVGSGNVPAYINKTCDVPAAANDIMLSKTFDNGMICASEQAVIIDKEISDEFRKILQDNNCYFVKGKELEQLSEFCFPKEKGCTLNGTIVGQSAEWIAQQAGFEVPKGTKILVAPIDGVGEEYPLSKEKLSPVLAYIEVDSVEQGFDLSKQMLILGGMGHSASIHTKDNDMVAAFGEKMQVGRILVNSPSSQGGVGDIYNTNMPSLTLGCGSFGRNSTTQNVSTTNLINIKRVAKRRTNMQWFKIPPKIYFEHDSIQYLEKMPEISRAFIVTDPMMVQLGNVDKILHYLRKRKNYCHAEIFSDVESDPSVETIMRGVEAMNRFQPDVIIALGGGSAMDAAKGMWLFYEHPDTSFDGLRLKFMDIRKRAFHFPNLGQKAKMVAIPTTSGTGSEVTSFSVITDKNNNIKYPLADYELTPDVAIIDPQFVQTLPKGLIADTGMDVLTHAIEAYVSVLASDFTDGLALQAIKLVFQNLKKSYEGDPIAREKMHNASCIAGMAFTNAFLGLNHSMAHKLGGEYHIPHGRANAILLPWVIEYNAQKPTKFATWPKYSEFIADQRYAEIAQTLGLPAATPQEGVHSLVQAIRQLNADLNITPTIQGCNVDETLFMAHLDDLSEKAHEDQCTTANPRYPLISEIKDLYRRAYYGKEKE